MRVIAYADLQESDVVLIELGDEVRIVTVKKEENGAIILGDGLSVDYGPGHEIVVLSRGPYFPKRIRYGEQEIIFFGKAVPIKSIKYTSRKNGMVRHTRYEIPKELQRSEEAARNYVKERVLEIIPEIPATARFVMKEYGLDN